MLNYECQKIFEKNKKEDDDFLELLLRQKNKENFSRIFGGSSSDIDKRKDWKIIKRNPKKINSETVFWKYISVNYKKELLNVVQKTKIYETKHKGTFSKYTYDVDKYGINFKDKTYKNMTAEDVIYYLK